MSAAIRTKKKCQNLELAPKNALCWLLMDPNIFPMNRVKVLGCSSNPTGCYGMDEHGAHSIQFDDSSPKNMRITLQ